MAEYLRQVSVVRTIVDRQETVKPVDVATELFGRRGETNRRLITFALDPINNDQEPQGTFTVLQGHEAPAVLFKPYDSLQLNGDYADLPLRRILETFAGSGIPFFQISGISTLSKARSVPRQGTAEFFSFQSQAELDFSRRTIIPQASPFRVEGAITLGQIVAGEHLEVGPLVVGDFNTLRQGWNRAGIAL